MLFSYPIAATAENWLHECICSMVQTIHHSYDSGHAVPTWPNIIPIACRVQLRRRTGLRERLNRYSTAAGTLNIMERQQVLLCLVQQNRIADLVSCVTDCEKINSLPAVIRDPVSDLFGFAFELLTDLGVRDRYYSIIFNGVSDAVCPFCGCEYFDHPEAPREDLDHYLAKNHYPFAAVNLRNLIPMGMKCNERYKQAQDILVDDAGARRRSFDPYGHQQVNIALGNSIPFGGADGRTPDWQIEFDPYSVECNTWDDVFSIRERYRRDVLDRLFFTWLSAFANWFRLRMGILPPSDQDISNALQQYIVDLRNMNLSGRDFLRPAVFQMLYSQCAAGNTRLQDFMRDLVSM